MKINGMTITGLKKSVGEFNNFPGAAVITLDSTGKLECTVGIPHCYVSGYHEVACKDGLHNVHATMEGVKEYIRRQGL